MDKKKWYELWQYFNQEHNLLLLETELLEIIDMVRQIDKDEKSTIGEIPKSKEGSSTSRIDMLDFGQFPPKYDEKP